jgi:hypothetical protein
VLRKVAAADDKAAVLVALSAEDNVALAMEPINWQLIGLIEEQADLHLLQPNDDPGGALSAQ